MYAIQQQCTIYDGYSVCLRVRNIHVTIYTMWMSALEWYKVSAMGVTEKKLVAI